MTEAIHPGLVLGLFFLANGLYLVSYLLRDILWLRIVAVVAALTTMPYFIIREEPMYAALVWQAAFLGVNLVNSAILMRERQPVELTEEQRRLHTQVFSLFTARQMLRILRAGEWRDAESDETLIASGDTDMRLVLVIDGRLGIHRDGECLTHLSDGQFAGEMGHIVWQRDRLQRLWQRQPELQRLFESTLSLDLVHKLAGTRVEVPDA
jgi:hypothetical protein